MKVFSSQKGDHTIYVIEVLLLCLFVDSSSEVFCKDFDNNKKRKFNRKKSDYYKLLACKTQRTLISKALSLI